MTRIMPLKAKRSLHAADLMLRLWDTHNSTWIMKGSKTIWSQKKAVRKLRQTLIDQGRNPDHLVIYKVSVEVISEVESE